MQALEMIQADPRWRDGSAVYAEAHCVSVLFGHAWSTRLAAPLPDGDETILEWRTDTSDDPTKDGFWLRFVRAEELPKRPPRMMATEEQGQCGSRIFRGSAHEQGLC